MTANTATSMVSYQLVVAFGASIPTSRVNTNLRGVLSPPISFPTSFSTPSTSSESRSTLPSSSKTRKSGRELEHGRFFSSLRGRATTWYVDLGLVSGPEHRPRLLTPAQNFPASSNSTAAAKLPKFSPAALDTAFHANNPPPGSADAVVAGAHCPQRRVLIASGTLTSPYRRLRAHRS